MFEYELNWLPQGLLHSVVVQEPDRTAVWLAQLAYDWLFVKTGIVDRMTNMTTIAQAGPRGPLDVRYLTAQGVSMLQNYGLAALCTVLTLTARLVILAVMTLLFLMAAFTGLVGDLMRRDLRKFGAGQEPSYLCHKARGSVIPLTVVPWTFYLAIPISINPLLILLPCAVLLSIAVYITASTFEKYL